MLTWIKRRKLTEGLSSQDDAQQVAEDAAKSRRAS